MGKPGNRTGSRPFRSLEFAVSYTKFSVVGLSNGVVDYGTLNLLLWLLPADDPTRLVFCNVVALLLTNINSYAWNTLWTFRGRAEHSRRQISGFAAQALLNIGVASGVVWLASRLLFAHTALPPIIVNNSAKVLSSVVVTTLSFLILRYLVFGRGRGGPGEKTGDERPGAGSLAQAVPPGKVLVLTAAVGGGHEAAGRAVRDELERAGSAVVMADGLRAMSRVLSRSLSRGYCSQVRGTPRFLGALFAVTYRRAGAATMRFLIGALFARRLLKVVRKERPELVISTYPLVTAALGRLRERGRLRVPAAAMITDYGVHPLWVDPRVDLHLVSSRPSAELAERAGGTSVLARLPVAEGFSAAPTRDEARMNLGLPPEAFVALVVGGALGSGDMGGAARCAAESGAYTVVVTGENARLNARLRAEFATNEGVRVMGWTDEMPALMAAADCLIQNAGGMACIEAMEVGLPILFFDPILGHGELNARVMEEAGAALWVRTAEDLEGLLRSLARGETSLPPANREPAAPSVSDILGSVTLGAPRPTPARRALGMRSFFAGAAALVICLWLVFASSGLALAEKGFRLRVPGYDPPPGRIALAARATDPTTAAALESWAYHERVPLTIFTDAGGAEGLRPSPGLAFGVAEEPAGTNLSSPRAERSKARAAAAEIRKNTGTYPEYFLPAPETDLAALAYAPPHTRLATPKQTARGVPRPGLLVVETSDLDPQAARERIAQALRSSRREGLRCVPLAEL